MSMLSSQCDELREYAERADGTFPLLSGALRNAADIILELRDDLQRANNDLQDAEHDESVAWDRVRKAEAETAKLRELVRELLPCYQWSDCYGGCMAADGPLCPRPAKLTERARELGVVVD